MLLDLVKFLRKVKILKKHYGQPIIDLDFKIIYSFSFNIIITNKAILMSLSKFQK
jgi:hypothetical protein